MLRIRLRRVGKKKKPMYRIVVADSRAPRDGAFVESLGYYHPLDNPSTIVINDERAKHWLEKGAMPSDRVAKILKIQGLAELPPKLAARIALGDQRAKDAAKEKAKAPADTTNADEPAAEAETPAAEATADQPATEVDTPAAEAKAPAAEATAEEQPAATAETPADAAEATAEEHPTATAETPAEAAAPEEAETPAAEVAEKELPAAEAEAPADAEAAPAANGEEKADA